VVGLHVQLNPIRRFTPANCTAKQQHQQQHQQQQHKHNTTDVLFHLLVTSLKN